MNLQGQAPASLGKQEGGSRALEGKDALAPRGFLAGVELPLVSSPEGGHLGGHSCLLFGPLPAD